jgi:hypothetical protein
MRPVCLQPVHSEEGYQVRLVDDVTGDELWATEWCESMDVALYDARGALDTGETEVNVADVMEVP